MTKTTAVDLLIKVRELLSDPTRWTKNAYARHTKSGRKVNSNSPHAGQWCLSGALERVGGSETLCYMQAWHILQATAEEVSFPSVLKLNDAPETTHADVLAAVDAAIELAQRDTLERTPEGRKP